MEYVTPQHLYWLLGTLIGINGVVIGYWIKVVNSVVVELKDHKENDEKEFAQSVLDNDREHSALRLEIAQAEGRTNTKVAEIGGKIDLANQKIDGIIKTLEQMIKQQK